MIGGSLLSTSADRNAKNATGDVGAQGPGGGAVARRASLLQLWLRRRFPDWSYHLTTGPGGGSLRRFPSCPAPAFCVVAPCLSRASSPGAFIARLPIRSVR